ncbi:MAG TPA: twin-arginine translocase TatA/TatE family subunit [Candidatus Baltobacteraceae bacterium]|nr:twin-arginine translocase TatA/TatE family subunit [Candidatus Baltobacteraceae bacterium]
MLSLPDMAVLGVLALLVFGEERLPSIVRQAGRMMREVQNTSHSFVREMERAADLNDPRPPVESEEPPPRDVPEP